MINDKDFIIKKRKRGKQNGSEKSNKI